MNLSYKTAISRKKLPLPVQYLIDCKVIIGDVLDFGCGKCADINPPSWDSYDPYYKPDGIKKTSYDTILCTYVLNVLDREGREEVVERVSSLLKDPYSVAYFVVRRDLPQNVVLFSKNKKTSQRYVSEAEFKFYKMSSMYRGSHYEIFFLAK